MSIEIVLFSLKIVVLRMLLFVTFIYIPFPIICYICNIVPDYVILIGIIGHFYYTTYVMSPDWEDSFDLVGELFTVV
jgi:hypothetical protein